jgi:hypothetical protein
VVFSIILLKTRQGNPLLISQILTHLLVSITLLPE